MIVGFYNLITSDRGADDAIDVAGCKIGTYDGKCWVNGDRGGYLKKQQINFGRVAMKILFCDKNGNRQFREFNFEEVPIKTVSGDGAEELRYQILLDFVDGKGERQQVYFCGRDSFEAEVRDSFWEWVKVSCQRDGYLDVDEWYRTCSDEFKAAERERIEAERAAVLVKVDVEKLTEKLVGNDYE